MGCHNCPDAIGAAALDDYTFRALFADGSVRDYDCRSLMERGVFTALRDPVIFRLIHTEMGALVWNENLDLAPEEVYINGEMRL